jgi:hypothetical protein
MTNNEFYIFENFLSNDECHYVLNKCHEELTLETAGVANGNPNERKSSVSWIDDLGDINIRLKVRYEHRHSLYEILVQKLGFIALNKIISLKII